MGRTEKSQGLAPPAIRKDLRAKQARHIINKVIPAILASNSRARKGVEGNELIVDPGPVKEVVQEKEKADKDDDVTYVKRKGQGRRKVKGARGDENLVTEGNENDTKSKHSKSKGNKRSSLDHEDFAALSINNAPSPQTEDVSSTKRQLKRRIRIITTDTLTAAHMLSFPAKYPNQTESLTSTDNKKKPHKVNTCILSMASPLRPGGGVLTGATSQEEFLCARTTLLPSLKETFYRLPEIGGIYTHDVLVFRSSSSDLSEHSGVLGPGERYWIDVISAGMLRFPELEGEEGGKRLGRTDREAVEKKMRGVLRIAGAKGVRKIVLGAWGCGAYGNPVADIARAWRTVLDPNVAHATSSKKGKGAEEKENWEQLEEVVFAISNGKMAREFAKEFGGGVEVESGPGGGGDEEEEGEGEDTTQEELRTKIKEMEGQIAQVWNPDLKARMGVILEGLRAQVTSRDGEDGEDGEDGSASSNEDGKDIGEADSDGAEEDGDEEDGDEDDEEEEDSGDDSSS